MAQSTYPWPGIAPGSGVDAGRYTNEEWTAVWVSMMRAGGLIESSVPLRTLAALANIGVFYCVGNALEVTNPGAAANTIQIDTGAALAEGQFFYNDTAVTFTVPSSKTNDLIVLRRNYTAAAFTPADSVDADEVVPAYTTRITRLDIAGGDVFTQDTTRATYWDIPLADITTDAAGAVTINSDDREYVDAEIKYAFVPALVGRDTTGAADIIRGTQVYGVGTPDNALSRVASTWRIPVDFITGVINATIEANVISAATGNAYSRVVWAMGTNGQAYNFTASAGGLGATAVTAGQNNEVNSSILVGPIANSYVVMYWERDATNILDTVNDIVYVSGFKITYLGWR